ncbi:hypothetical protein BS47DRAFT_15396 [Hydnum rufescens UP504]|uniref:Redoxin domain-containing protein n=1 Tax=Hydnum rufescens UP504 TaxID=1448309 RepID=A0A9P6E2G0_9AGAM|nr:hypothetical protein BS47DRAFT_15396 [Hydnum rufescens UP504]
MLSPQYHCCPRMAVFFVFFVKTLDTLESRVPQLLGPGIVRFSDFSLLSIDLTMATINVGDTIPSATFSYVPYSEKLEDGLACGIPVKLSTDEWKGKKVVLFAVPGAFTPTCHVSHLPGFVKHYDELKGKGVDVIAALAYNDAWV